MVVRNGVYPLVDTNNIADAYEGLLHTFAARRADVEQLGDTAKVNEFNKNLDFLEDVITNYDRDWGISNLHSDHAEKIEERWDDLWDALNRAELTPETKDNLRKWKFLDAKGKEIPQYTKTNRLDKSGRMAAIIDLTRHDIAKQHVAHVNEKIDEDALAAELNEKIEFKLYNLAVADKIVNDATLDPEQFNDPAYRQQLMAELTRDGATISDAGYNAQIDADVNATAGWAARVKAKLGTAAENVSGFFGKIFRPVSRVDRLANVRMTGGAADKRAKRIEFFKRILKGFASAFIASALITTIATAAAATAGISLAASMAAIGIVTAIGMGVIQVMRWRKAQQKAGKPTDIHAFLADKRLVTSLGVSAIAVVAMCFGAAGMASAAIPLGYGAMALGGGKNAVETFRDARNSGISVAESLAWAIANAGAVIAGGFTGRMAANAGISYYNERNPENTLFQNKSTHTATREVTDTRDVTEIRHELTPEAQAYAKRTVESWYRNNPDLLQQRIDGINEYNATHGTDFDPYRVLLANGHAGGLTADNNLLHVENSHLDPNINDVHSHGIHKSMTDAWGAPRDISHQTINDAAHNLFNADGSVNEAGMNAIGKVEPYIYEHGQVGPVHGVGNPSSADHVFHDKYFPDNDPRGWTTYGDGKPAYVDNEYTHPETFTRTESFDVTDYNPVNVDGMAAFGNYNPRTERKLRDRIGQFKPFVPRDRTPEPILEEDDDDFGTLPPAVIDKPELPVRQNDNDKVYPPVHVPRGKVEFPVRREQPGVPVKQHTEKPVVVPVHDDHKAEQKIFAVTRAQGKAWKDLHEHLERTKKQRDNTSGERQRKYNIEIKRLENEINELHNKLGKAPVADIDLAADQAIQRGKLEDLLKHAIDLKNWKPDENADFMTRDRWQRDVEQTAEEIQKLRDELGYAAYNVNLWFPEPVEGFQKQMKRKKTAQYLDEIDVPVPVRSETTARAENAELNDDMVEPTETVNRDSRSASFDRYFSGTPRLNIDINDHRMPKLDLSRFKKSKFNDVSDDEIRVRGGDDKTEEKTVKTESKEPKYTELHERPKHNERGCLVGALRRAYDKMKKTVAGREYFVPEALVKAAEQGGLINRKITEIRGVPVYLVDLSGNNNQITQNGDRAVILVDVNGLRIPFFLENGNEGGTAGHWKPLPELHRDGKWLSWVFDNNNLTDIPELVDIGRALDAEIGDVRNYRDTGLTAAYNAEGYDGFVGGADAIEHIEPNKVFQLVRDAKYNSPRMIFAPYGDARVGTDPSWLADYLDDIEAPGYQENKIGLFAGLRNRFGRK